VEAKASDSEQGKLCSWGCSLGTLHAALQASGNFGGSFLCKHFCGVITPLPGRAKSAFSFDALLRVIFTADKVGRGLLEPKESDDSRCPLAVFGVMFSACA
jgi:hypothetical protein